MILYGTRFYGTVDQCGSSRIATRFFHIWFFPLFPIQSILFLEGEKGVATSFSWRSVLAAYLRVPAIVAAVAVAVSASNADTTVEAIVLGLLAAALLAGSIASWVVLGKLTPEQRAQRAVYGAFIGAPVDPKDMGMQVHDLRSQLQKSMDEIVQTRRIPVTDRESLRALCKDPNFTDRDALFLLLTLYRTEFAIETLHEKTRAGEAHQGVWNRIQQLNYMSLIQY